MSDIPAITKDNINEFSDFDLLRACLKESLESHKLYNTEYWRGSKAMIENVLQTMDIIETKRKELNNE